MGRSRELDALESLGEAFGEACEHVARASAFDASRLGPLETLPMASLWPGEFGWQRAVTFADGTSGGNLLCFLRPGSSRERTDSPLPGTDPSSYAYLEVLSGPPWRIVAATSRDGIEIGQLKGFANAVASELRSE